MSRFSHDLVFLLSPSRCLSIRLPLPMCTFRFLESLSRVLFGLSLTCANIPTRSSSTLWSKPLEVSMNLQPQLLASRRPTGKQNRFRNSPKRTCLFIRLYIIHIQWRTNMFSPNQSVIITKN